MSRITRAKRGRVGAKRADLSDLRELVKDGRLWTQLAVVKAPGTGSHWERDQRTGDILVEVQTVPRGLELTCRLGASAGGIGRGLWLVPDVGTEVLVAIPDGEPDHHPVIVACLSSGGAPDRVSDQRTILVATGEVEITAPLVKIGPDPASFNTLTMGALNGEAVDPYTGLTHAQLGNASSSVVVKK